MKFKIKNQKGMTLIETLVYIALLSILMVGVVFSIDAIIGSEQEKSKFDALNDSSMLMENYHVH